MDFEVIFQLERIQLVEKDKPRIAIIALTPLFERSWIETNVLQSVSEHFDIQLFNTYQISSAYQSESIQHLFSFRERKIALIVMTIAWITFRKKSPTFMFRLKRFYMSDFLWIQSKLELRQRFTHLYLQTHNFLKLILTNKRTIWWLIPFKKNIFKLIKYFIIPNKKIANTFKDFEVVIIHSGGNEIFVPLICRSMRKAKIKTFMTVENWDNLTSKQILFEKPDYVSVIGAVDIHNAIEIHNLERQQIYPIGLPKFDFLRDFIRKDGEDYDVLNLLYIGVHLPHDEVGLLNKLYKELEGSDIRFKLRYRPHPSPADKLSFENLDSRIETIKLFQNGNSGGLPSLNENYLNGIMEADLVIGPLTTLILECMHLRIPCFIDATDDNIHRTTSSRSIQNYLHLKDFYNEFKEDSFVTISGGVELIKRFDLAKSRAKTYRRLDIFGSPMSSSFAERFTESVQEIIGIKD
jgi:hypothetical protein